MHMGGTCNLVNGKQKLPIIAGRRRAIFGHKPKSQGQRQLSHLPGTQKPYDIDLICRRSRNFTGNQAERNFHFRKGTKVDFLGFKWELYIFF